MNNGNNKTEIICLEFPEKKQVFGVGNVWLAKFTDYGSQTIAIVPDNRYFIPECAGFYLATKPQGYRAPISFFEGHPVYKTKIFDLMPELRENIAIYRADFFIPFCFMKKNETAVVFRPSTYKNKNQFALIWANDELVRERLERYLRKNIPFTNLSMNSSCVIAIEGQQGESQEGFEEKIICSINYCKG